MKYLLGDITFQSKKECEDFVKKIKEKGKMNDEDKKIIFELLKKHSKYETYFKNRLKFDNYNSIDSAYYEFKGVVNRCFYIINNDDYVEPFSYIKCFNSKKSKKILGSFRETIEDQILIFRREQFKNKPSLVCELCKIMIYNNLDTHVDHIYKFKDMVNDFCEVNNLNIEEIEEEQLKFNFIREGTHIIKEKYDGTNVNIRMFKNKELLNNWINFHKEKAELRVICSCCNLQRK
jgi:hypothetical protein